MDLTPESLGTGVVGLIIILGAIGKYLSSLKAKQSDPVLGGVGLELGNRAQIDMLIAAINRIGDILENKKQAGLEEMLKEIRDDMDAMKQRKGTGRPRPR